MDLKRQLGLTSAIFIIIADMIGTGIFSTTGFILADVHSATLVLVLWVIGGFVALTGSLSYAELATMWPEAGGEYQYLKKIYGPLPAFLTGWISLFVGFSAAVATSSMVLGKYFLRFVESVGGSENAMFHFLNNPVMIKMVPILLIIFFGLVHIIGVRSGSMFQNILTALKIGLVVLLAGVGLFSVNWGMSERLTAVYAGQNGATSASIPATGLALLMVMFAYSGWNAATYMGAEIKKPEKNLPRALFFGTLIVMVLYLMLNVVYIMAIPGAELVGLDTVGDLATRKIFSPGVARFFNLAISIILLSAVSAQMMIGPRVYYAMAKEKMLFSGLGSLSERFGTPAKAILVQIVIAVFYILIGSPEKLMMYMGFALSIFPVMAIVGLFIARKKFPDAPRPYKVHFYPVVPALYVVLTVCMMGASLIAWTNTSLWAIFITLCGIPIYFAWKILVKKKA